jgi:FkbM family methyltransferase
MIDLAKTFLRDIFTPLDYWRYLFWRLSRSNKPITVTLQNRERIIIRPLPKIYRSMADTNQQSSRDDRLTAHEVFLVEVYKKPVQVPEISPQLIIDIGANVGYSVVYFADKYPHANIIAFEPHPAHFVSLEQHLKINGLSDRVRVEKIAVSNCNTEMFLTDLGCRSTLVEDGDSDCLSVKVCDFFTWIGTQKVDLLKMDIEGGEYAILNDARFTTVDIPTIVMEWHNTETLPDGRHWCTERLISLGYKIAAGKGSYQNGILWAWKD